MQHHRSIAMLILVACIVALGCAGTAAGQSRSPGPLATAPASDVPDASAPPPHGEIPPEIAEAIALRKDFGLRSDEAWVRLVAANPAAVMDFGVPLMPFERDEIMTRTPPEAIIEQLNAYMADHLDVAGGMYIDQAAGGAMTILVTDDPDDHRAALAALLGPETPIAIRQVRWTEAELRDLQDRIAADMAFIDSLPARFKSAGVNVFDNVAELSISSAVPDAAERIIAHFDAHERLHVDTDGTGILLQPTGRILGHIVAPPGTDMTNLSPQYEADVDIGGRDSIGIGVEPDGSFVIDHLPPATYTITIVELADAGNLELGHATVVLPAGAAVPVEIPLQRP